MARRVFAERSTNAVSHCTFVTLKKTSLVCGTAIIARIELQYSYDIVALVVGKPNANAARVAVTRALARLAASLK